MAALAGRTLARKVSEVSESKYEANVWFDQVNQLGCFAITTLQKAWKIYRNFRG